MPAKKLDEWLQWLEGLHPKAIDLGLERIQRVAESLNLTAMDSQIVTVAGTNGKGSTIAVMSALLSLPHGQGNKPSVGVYTSPHLQHFNERIVINGQAVSDQQLCEAFAIIEKARLKLCGFESDCDDSHHHKDVITLSYFEFTTLAAFWLFKQASLDYLLLEVGLGGRLDAVNILSPNIAVITSIDIDHEQWLGSSRNQIALEKAGILRPDIPAIIADPDPPAGLIDKLRAFNCISYPWNSSLDADAAIKSRSMLGNKQQANFVDYGHGFIARQSYLTWCGYTADHENVMLESNVETTQLHLASWSAALQVAALLGATPGLPDFNRLLRQTTLPGRQTQYCKFGHDFLLDVAHNTASVESLAKLLAQPKVKDCRIFAVFAAMADKPIEKMLSLMSPLVDQWVFPELKTVERAAAADKVLDIWASIQHFVVVDGQVQKNRELAQDKAEKSSAIIMDNVTTAINWAVQQATAKDRIVIFGSFYTVAEALDWLDNDDLVSNSID